MIVVVLPGWRDRPGIAEAVEGLKGQDLVTEATVKALGIAVLSGLPSSTWSSFTGKSEGSLAPFVADRTNPGAASRADIQR